MNVTRSREDTSMRISLTLARNVGMANAIFNACLMSQVNEQARKKEDGWKREEKKATRITEWTSACYACTSLLREHVCGCEIDLRVLKSLKPWLSTVRMAYRVKLSILINSRERRDI